MKICFVSNATSIGGAERVLLETIDLLLANGVFCCALLPGEGELAEALKSAAVPYGFHHGGAWVAWQKPTLWKRVKMSLRIARAVIVGARITRRWNCDLIYSNALTTCQGAIIAKVLHLPHIWHLHEFGKADHNVFYMFGERFTNRAIGVMSSACIAVSNALADKYRLYMKPSKLIVIYPSMQMASTALASCNREMELRSTGAVRLLVIAGLVEGKGQLDAVQALACLAREGIIAELTLVGDSFPDYRDRLEQHARSNELTNRVYFAGRVKDASPFLRETDILLVCSRSEAFGRATVEGMLAGKPVIGARCGATRELIQDGATGLLYNCGDAPDLARKIRFLVERPSVARKIAESGHVWAEARFTKTRYTDQMLGVLASVANTTNVLVRPAAPEHTIPAQDRF